MNSRFFIIFSMGMTVAYIVFGCVIAFTSGFDGYLTPTVKYVFAAFVIAYGIFRGYRAVKLYNLNKNESK